MIVRLLVPLALFAITASSFHASAAAQDRQTIEVGPGPEDVIALQGIDGPAFLLTAVSCRGGFNDCKHLPAIMRVPIDKGQLGPASPLLNAHRTNARPIALASLPNPSGWRVFLSDMNKGFGVDSIITAVDVDHDGLKTASSAPDIAFKGSVPPNINNFDVAKRGQEVDLYVSNPLSTFHLLVPLLANPAYPSLTHCRWTTGLCERVDTGDVPIRFANGVAAYSGVGNGVIDRVVVTGYWKGRLVSMIRDPETGRLNEPVGLVLKDLSAPTKTIHPDNLTKHGHSLILAAQHDRFAVAKHIAFGRDPGPSSIYQVSFNAIEEARKSHDGSGDVSLALKTIKQLDESDAQAASVAVPVGDKLVIGQIRVNDLVVVPFDRPLLDQ